MQKLKIGLAAVLVALTGQAVAGAFDGPYVQLGIGGASTQTESNYNELGLGNRNSNEGAFLGQILGGYSKAFDRFNLAGNAYTRIQTQAVISSRARTFWFAINCGTKFRSCLVLPGA